FVERAIAALGIAEAIEPLRSDPSFGDGVAPASESVRGPFYAAVEAAVRTRSRDAWLEILEGADVPVAPVLESEAFLANAQGRANGFSHLEDRDDVPIAALGPAVRLSATPAVVRRPRPSLGASAPTAGPGTVGASWR